jgi:hypothetical protein
MLGLGKLITLNNAAWTLIRHDDRYQWKGNWRDIALTHSYNETEA